MASAECDWCGRIHWHRRDRIACIAERRQANRQRAPQLAASRPVADLEPGLSAIPFLADRPTITLIVDGPSGRARATYHRSPHGAQCPDPPPLLAWLPPAGDPTPVLRERGLSFFWVSPAH